MFKRDSESSNKNKKSGFSADDISPNKKIVLTFTEEEYLLVTYALRFTRESLVNTRAFIDSDISKTILDLKTISDEMYQQKKSGY